MLGRLLRSMFSPPPRTAADGPSAEQQRLAQQILAAAEASRHEALDELLAALGRTGPPSAEVHRHLGSHLGRLGRLDLARAQLEAALAIEPDHAAGWIDLGHVHRLARRIDAAGECYQRALSLAPEDETAQLGLAAVDGAAGRDEAALVRLRGMVQTNAAPAAVQALVDLLDRLRRTDEARQVCLDVLDRDPQHGVAHAALGFLLLKREYRPEDALDCFDRALAAGLRDVNLHSNRGIALQDLGRLAEALASYDAALALDPDHPLARFHRALARLMQGDFGRAWDDYETRLASVDRPAPPCELPVWDGTPTDDALVVYGEQGIGDEIMFASCLPDLLRRCPNVTLACSAKLEAIFRRSFPQVRVLDLAQAGANAPTLLAGSKRMVAIGSLPRHFRRARADFPAHAGYLRADPQQVSEYRARLEALGPALNVGLSWRGGTDKTRRALRSVDLDMLAPLLELPGTRFVNLQYDSRSTDPELVPLLESGRLVHWQDALDDYPRTAALVASLDVVVSVCTAVIHLAGALGRPTLVMASFSPEWRYGIRGEAMPWYPSVRIARQRAAREWDGVIAAVRDQLLARLPDRGGA